MKRIWRWMLNGLTAVSLVLCVATVGLWVRPQIGVAVERASRYGYIEVFACGGYFSIHTDFGIELDDSEIGWSIVTPSHFPRDVRSLQPLSFESHIPPTLQWDIGGCGFTRWRVPSQTITDVWVPYWLTAPATALLPSVRLIAAAASYGVKTHRRKRAGGCPACHYNLTGNVSGVCPECGTKVTQKPVV